MLITLTASVPSSTKTTTMTPLRNRPTAINRPMPALVRPPTSARHLSGARPVGHDAILIDEALVEDPLAVPMGA
ncbi:hypothetical protein ACTZWT_10160 [Rhodopseudomonas sp. NSM]|uniref:hypothetical protein n=1 Tax=Rhodopseudomonas sp. NSM TaxID=3457630 RepID=UPI0040356C1C